MVQLGRTRPTGQNAQISRLDRSRVVSGHPRDPSRSGEWAFFDAIADQVAVHQQEPLGDGPHAAIEFVFAIVAVPLHEFIEGGESKQAHENVGFGVERSECGL